MLNWLSREKKFLATNEHTGIKNVCVVFLVVFMINPVTARVFDTVLWGNSNFWVCGRNPMMWPFKWKLSACTFTWCYLFVKILENEIWKFGQNWPLAISGSERVKEEKRIWSPESTEKILSFMRESNPWPMKFYWVTGILWRAVLNPYLIFFLCS